MIPLLSPFAPEQQVSQWPVPHDTQRNHHLAEHLKYVTAASLRALQYLRFLILSAQDMQNQQGGKGAFVEPFCWVFDCVAPFHDYP